MEREYTSRVGVISVEDDVDGYTLKWKYAYDYSDDEPVELVRYRPSQGLLSLSPKVPKHDRLEDQYAQVDRFDLELAELDFDHERPVGDDELGNLVLIGLPRGFGHIFSYGLGFPRGYRSFVHTIEDISPATVVRFGSERPEGLADGVFSVSFRRFEDYRAASDRNRDRGRVVVRRVNDVEARNSLGPLVGESPASISLGRHPTVQAITRSLADETPLDDFERIALTARMGREAATVAREDPASFGALAEEVDLAALDVLIEGLERGLTGAMARDEDAWQQFFERNIFALQQMFSAPIALFGEQLHLKDTDAKGAGGRIADFVLVNSVTKDLLIVEIKTPAARLVSAAYRGKAGAEVFPPHRDFAGSLAQLQGQVQSAVADFPAIVARTKGMTPIEAVVTRGALIIGRVSDLSVEEKASFLRFRSGLAAVDVMTFDEVLERVKALVAFLRAPGQGEFEATST